MAAVGEAPFLEMVINLLAGQGVQDIMILTSYRAEMVEDFFRDKFPGPTRIRFWRDPTPLGTGGAVRNAAKFATDPTLLVNGDTFFDVDLDMLLQFHLHKGAAVTFSLMRVDDVGRYGSVLVDQDGRITGFTEKDEGPAGPGLINGGVTLLSKEFILGLPENRAFSMEREIYPSFVKSGKMFGLLQERAFFDIGTPESYKAFQEFAKNQRVLAGQRGG